MRSNFVTILLCGFASLNCSVYAQQWGGANDQTSAISRTGSISTGSINVSGNNSNFIGPDINVSRTSTAEGVGKGVALQLNDIGSGTHSMIQHSPGGLQFFNFNGSSFLERMRISTNGNVGIGTSTPAAKLNIYAQGSQTRVIIGNPSTGSGGFTTLDIGTSADVNGYTFMQAVKSSGTAYGDIVMNASGGNVGIGTTNPTDRLAVIGNISIPLSNSIGFGHSDRFTYDGKSVSNYALGWYIDSGNAAAATSYYSGYGGMKFFTQALPRITISQSGNVGIGTVNPNQKLTVNGTIYGKEVKVDLSVPGPDYVFEENYNLPSLTDTENYIKQNKHLPEVPSACEMEEKGINLSEMNMILLKKVEELTLYLLKQNKTIAEQNERLLKLENKN